LADLGGSAHSFGPWDVQLERDSQLTGNGLEGNGGSPEYCVPASPGASCSLLYSIGRIVKALGLKDLMAARTGLEPVFQP
jgi:hypothetical protein